MTRLLPYDAAGNPTATYQGQTRGREFRHRDLQLRAAIARPDAGLSRSTSIRRTKPAATTPSQTPPAACRCPTVGSTTTPLGDGWYDLGSVTLAAGDLSSTVTVNYLGLGTVSQVTLLEQTSATVYDGMENPLSVSRRPGQCHRRDLRQSRPPADDLARPERGLYRRLRGVQQRAAIARPEADLRGLREFHVGPQQRLYLDQGQRFGQPLVQLHRRLVGTPLGRGQLVRSGHGDLGGRRPEFHGDDRLVRFRHGRLAGRLAGADLGHGLRCRGQRPLADRRPGQRHDHGYNNLEQQVSTSQGQIVPLASGSGGVRQPAADAGRAADLHRLRPGEFGPQRRQRLLDQRKRLGQPGAGDQHQRDDAPGRGLVRTGHDHPGRERHKLHAHGPLLRLGRDECLPRAAHVGRDLHAHRAGGQPNQRKRRRHEFRLRCPGRIKPPRATRPPTPPRPRCGRSRPMCTTPWDE